MSYTIVLIIHLFCAIIFIGFVFADVIVLPAMKKVLNEEEHQKVMNAISNRARAIFPVSVLILILSGGFMLSKYVNSDLGAFNTTLQQLLMLKVIIALVIVAGILYSLSRKLFKKQPHPIMKHFHKFVLVCGIVIIILAKLMFVT
ncbi:hypothetical protein [Arcobacter sp. LA11]|uniref:hypothetical protein n=1 Tax=Arcobacter sp. LA11 TaxID=1898176 RepID=UPI000933622F|nr:hypothetical protein [Arcobacter sp. LA11]